MSVAPTALQSREQRALETIAAWAERAKRAGNNEIVTIAIIKTRELIPEKRSAA